MGSCVSNPINHKLGSNLKRLHDTHINKNNIIRKSLDGVNLSHISDIIGYLDRPIIIKILIYSDIETEDLNVYERSISKYVNLVGELIFLTNYYIIAKIYDIRNLSYLTDNKIVGNIDLCLAEHLSLGKFIPSKNN